MNWAEMIVTCLKDSGVVSVAYVPDIVIGKCIRLMEKDPFFQIIAASREEEAVGILSGSYLGKGRGVLMMQVSGLGNCVTALASLSIPYQIPILLVISSRGELGEFNPCQVPMSKSSRNILDSLGIQHFTITCHKDISKILNGAIKLAFTTCYPVAIFLSTILTGGKSE